jgi:hypothetical protein
MRRIHGLPGIPSRTQQLVESIKARRVQTMTIAELERWIALELSGTYHQNVHRGAQAIPAQL